MPSATARPVEADRSSSVCSGEPITYSYILSRISAGRSSNGDGPCSLTPSRWLAERYALGYRLGARGTGLCKCSGSQGILLTLCLSFRNLCWTLSLESLIERVDGRRTAMMASGVSVHGCVSYAGQKDTRTMGRLFPVFTGSRV